MVCQNCLYWAQDQKDKTKGKCLLKDTLPSTNNSDSCNKFLKNFVKLCNDTTNHQQSR